jgi:hypothetical protein
MMAASGADAVDAALKLDAVAAGAAAASTRDAVGLDDMTDAVFTTPALPCKAIALRRINASSRPERVAVAVLSVVSAITYLDINGFVEVAIASTHTVATANSTN